MLLMQKKTVIYIVRTPARKGWHYEVLPLPKVSQQKVYAEKNDNIASP
jgi:hypothetical protein